MSEVWLGLMALAGTAAQSTQQDNQTPPTREARDETQSYVALKQREFEQNRKAFESLSKLPTLQAMIQLVQQQNPFQHKRVRGADAAAQATVRNLLNETVAHYLTSVGLSPADVRAVQRAGLDPVESAVRVIAGAGTAVDRTAISEYAFLGEVVAVNESSDKTVNSTIRVRPTSIIRNSPGRPLTGELEIELRNPFRDIGKMTAAPGQKYLFFVSSEVARFRQARGLHGRANRSNVFKLQLDPYRVEQDTLVPTEADPVNTYPSQPLAKFLEAVRPLASEPAA